MFSCLLTFSSSSNFDDDDDSGGGECGAFIGRWVYSGKLGCKLVSSNLEVNNAPKSKAPGAAPVRDQRHGYLHYLVLTTDY